MSAEVDSPPSVEDASTARPRRRWRRRGLIAAAISGVLALLLGLGVPWYASSEAGKGWLIEALEPELRTAVTIDSVEFGWASGLRIEGLRIAQPEGFAGDALHVDSVEADVALLGLLSGRVDVVARVIEPTVQVTRGRNGALNWPAVLPPPRDRERERRDPKDRDEFEWPRLHLDLGLERGSIEIVDLESGERERVHSIEGALSNEGFELPLSLRLQALAPAADEGSADDEATLELEAELDLRAGRASTAHLVLEPVDLAAWGALLAAFGGVVDRLEGSLGGTLSASWNTPANQRTRESAEISGHLRGSDVFVAGGILGPRSLRLPKVVLKPQLRWPADSDEIDTEHLDLELGVLRIRGTPAGTARELVESARGSALALDIVVRLDELMEQEGWRPEGVDELGGVFRLRAAAIGELWPRAPDFLPGALELRLKGEGGRVKFAGDMIPAAVKLPPAMTVDVPASWDGGGLRFRDALVELGETRLEFSGDLEDAVARAEASLTVDADLARALGHGYAGEHLEVEGPLRLRECRLEFPLDAGAAEDAGLPFTLRAAELELPATSFLGNHLSPATLSVRSEASRVTAKLESATLNNGPLALEADWPGAQLLTGPAHLRLGWSDGEVGGSWTPLLRYLVPLLSGLDVQRLDQLARVDFAAGIELEFEGDGRFLPDEGESWTQLLSGWSGHGSLNLADGAFTPSSQFTEVVELIGADTRLQFDRISTNFDLVDGFVVGPDLRLSRDGDPLELSGRTSLDGSLEWELELGPWLQRSERGRRVFELLGEDELNAKLGGSITSPRLDLKDLGEQVLRGGLKGLLDRVGRDPGGTLDRVRGLIDKDGGPPRR